MPAIQSPKRTVTAGKPMNLLELGGRDRSGRRPALGGQGVQGLLDYPPAQVLFFAGRELGIAQGIDDALGLNYAVRTHGLGHRRHRGYLSHRNSRLFQLGADRSSAASAGPSSRCQDHRVHPRFLEPGRHLTAHTPAVLQGVAVSGGGQEFFV